MQFQGLVIPVLVISSFSASRWIQEAYKNYKNSHNETNRSAARRMIDSQKSQIFLGQNMDRMG